MNARPPQRSAFRLFMGFWLPVLAYVTIIIVLSAQPYLTPPVTFRHSDKFYHLLEYGGLGLLLARALRATLRVTWALYAATMAVGIGVLVGAGDETLQRFVPGRVSSLYDLAADALGLIVAQLVYVRATRGRG